MLSLRTRLIVIFIITLIISWVMGLAFSAVTGWMSAVACLTILLVHQLWHASKLTQLLLSPSYGEVPGALGIW